jgi:LytS/YehU family sensor histidine kinase
MLPEQKNLVNIILKQGVAALMMTGIWLLLTMSYSEILDFFLNTKIWRVRFDQVFLLFAAAGIFLYFLAALIHYLILSLEKSREAEQQVLRNSLLASRAELNSLKATIHPHFLFNSLTALSTLTKTSPDLAHKVCIQLSDFLRYSLVYARKEWASVEDELEHIKSYLGIEKIRLGKRLTLDFSINEQAMAEQLPPFSLLPLVENAIKHGFQQTTESGTLTLQIEKYPNSMLILVKNPLDKASRTQTTSPGYGLKALKQRLTNAYGDNTKLIISKKEDEFVVKLQIPLEGKNE